MSKDMGASSGSQATPEAPAGLRPPGFDPARGTVSAKLLRRAQAALRDSALTIGECEELIAVMAERQARLLSALLLARSVAEEARVEWDEAPSGMRAGKLLIALSGVLPGYRSDIDEIHATIAEAMSDGGARD